MPVDPLFSDLALTRLFAIPSRVSLEEWKVIAAQIGASVRPSVNSIEPAPKSEEAPPPKIDAGASKGTGSSLADLLASLRRAKEEMKKAEEKEASKIAPPEPIYCPVYDWKKAVSLVRERASAREPGARRTDVAL